MKLPMRKRISTTAVAAVLTAGLAVGSAVVSSGTGASGATSTGTVTYALSPAVTPNYIFPLMPGSVYSNVNLYQFQQIMYRPLYWFGGGGSVAFNESLSLALPPVYTNGGKTVTIKLKNYKWSNGQTLTSQDVLFFMHMLKAEVKIWPIYVVGQFPDNVVSMSAPNASTVVFKLDKAYSTNWFLYNELSQITPFPHAWDKESATGAVGTYDTTPAGAAKVYNFLAAQAAKPADYSTNPLWQIVDGPFKLKTFETTGYTVFVPNTKYSGPIKASYSQLILQPFTTDTAEFNALRAGTVTYGYVPPQDSSQIPLLTSQGYTSEPWIGWSINYFSENFNNPTVGPMFRQLYIRQAIQEMVNQPVDIKKALYGYGSPTYGPVPIKPKNNLSTPQEASNPYPYSPKNSAKLLKSHGWDVKPGGTSTCANPGTGATQCGKGIKKGQQMVFTMQYASGTTSISQEMQQLKTNLAMDGIQLSLTTAPFNTVIANYAKCKVGPSCSWEIQNWGGGWSYGPDYYPTGESIFASTSSFDQGSYVDKTNDANINATTIVSGTAVLYKYENYLAKQLPDVWQPNADFQISEISTHLKGVTQSPLLNFTPENWKLSS